MSEEIIDFIRTQVEDNVNLAYEPDVELSFYEAKTLLNYITDLQQEKEKQDSKIKVLDKENHDLLDDAIKSEIEIRRLNHIINYIVEELETLKHRLDYEEDYCMEDIDIDNILKKVKELKESE